MVGNIRSRLRCSCSKITYMKSVFVVFRKLRENLIHFEETVKRQASQKGKLKHVDLRLCRLCYKTKFADGIGKACYDCHKRVCNRCGSFSKPKWNPKKNKVSHTCIIAALGHVYASFSSFRNYKYYFKYFFCEKFDFRLH